MVGGADGTRRMAGTGLAHLSGRVSEEVSTFQDREEVLPEVPDMNFVEDAVRLAFLRCEGTCQCVQEDHDHGHFTCKVRLTWDERGERREDGWRTLAIRPDELGGAANPENCLIVCWSCYRRAIP